MRKLVQCEAHEHAGGEVEERPQIHQALPGSDELLRSLELGPLAVSAHR